MSITPSADAQAIAVAQGSELANLAVPITTLQSAIAGGSLAPAASVDPLLTLGFQSENTITGLASNSTSSTSFVDLPGTSWTFTASIAKKYTVHVDTLVFFSAGATPFGTLRLVVNGSNGPSVLVHTATLNLLLPIHTMHNAALAAGSNTIKLQWAVNTGTYTMAVNSSCYANYIVSG